MRILVVDDSNDNLTLFKAILERKGYEITTALNGEEALQILHKIPVGLILSDILMPVMDGFRFLQECKSDSKLQKIPFIFVTGAFLDQKDEELAFKSGVVAFVRKPVEPDKLIEVVEEAFSQADSHKKVKKPKTEKADLDKEVSISLMEKLQTKMKDLEEEIAERKKAENALKQAESEFRLLFDTMDQGVIYQDAAGNIISANKAAENILGLPHDQLIGRNALDSRWRYIHEDGSDFPGHTHPTTIALRTGKPVKDIVMGIYNHNDDKFHWIKISTVPQFRPGEDKPYQVYATFDDITDQFLTFKALQEQEARQNAILENTTDAILAINSDSRITAANEASCILYRLISGTSRKFQVGDNILDLVITDRRPYWENIFKQALNGQKLVFENRYDTDQGPIDLEISVNPIISPPQGITGVSLFGKDITRRKQDEQNLRESELRYRTLIEYAAESIYVVQKGRIVFSRSGPSQITGYTGSELIGKRPSELVHPDDYQSSLADFNAQNSADKKSRKKYVFRVIAKSGAIRWVEAHVTDITWEDKPAILTFQTDITEHKQLEETIRKTNRLYRMLYECNEAVVMADTEKKLLQNICSVIVETGGYFMVWIGSAENDEAKSVRPLAYYGHMDNYLESIKITWADEELGRGPVGKAIRSGKTFVSQDIFKDPDFSPWIEQANEQGYRAIIALPLKSYGPANGVLSIYSSTADCFDQDEINLLEQLAADITYGITTLRERHQRERAEDALRDSEQRFRKAVQSTTDIVWDWDIIRGDLDWYGDIDKMLGYDRELLPRTRIAWESILDTADHDRVMAALYRLAQTGEPYNVEYRINHTDGSKRTWIDRGLAIRDRDGNIIRAVGACVDITDRRLEDERARIRRDLAFALANSDDLKEALQHGLEAAIKISGMESGVVYLLDDKTGDFNLVHYRDISASTIEIFTTLYADSEDTNLLSKGIPIYTPADMFTPRYKKLLKEEGWTFSATLPVMHKERTIACFVLGSHHFATLHRAARSSLETIATDLGMSIERIRSREALQASEERYRFIADHTKDVIWIMDKDLHYTYLSPSILMQRGYTVNEAMDTDLAQTATGESLKKAADQLFENISGDTSTEKTCVMEMELMRKDGTTFWSEQSITVLTTPDGQFAGLLGISRDITERREFEAELRKREAMFRVIFDNHYQFTGLLDPEGRVLTINNIALHFAGVRIDDVTGKYFWETPWWTHSATVQAECKSAIEKASRGEFIHYETTHINANGEERQVDFTLKPIMDDSGKVIYMVPEGRDITDIVKAQKAFQESEEKYRLLVETSNEGIFVTQDGLIKFANRRSADILGYLPNEILHEPIVNSIHPDDREMVMEKQKRRFQGEVIDDVYPFRVITKQGNTVWVEVGAVLCQWEGRQAILGFMTDITARKQAEDALRTSEEKYRLLVENAREGIIVLQDGKAKFVNRNSSETLGYTDSEIFSRSFIEFIHPDDRAAVIERYQRRMAGEVITEPLTIRLVATDGQYIWVDIRAVVIEWEGRPATLNFVTDITQRKQAEDELSNALETITSTLEGTMEAVAMMSELRDPYTAGHQKMVTHLALAIGREMGLMEDQLRGLRVAGLLHDVGKVYVPSEILSKPGKLTELEKGLAKAHASAGYEIVKAIKFPWPVDEMVYQHHERMDGSGYPRGLKSDQIMLEARILAVADTVEAMMSHRPYRPSLGLDKALEEITINRGKLYDETVVDACILIFKEKGFSFPQ